MMSKIYTITSISLSEKGEMTHDRCWGFFFDFNDAEQAVLSNDGDLYECSYNFVVIEEISEGIMSFSDRGETWYAWDSDKESFTKINKKPHCIKNVICFGMG